MNLQVFATSDIVSRERSMDELDQIIVAHNYLAGESDIDMWKNVKDVKDVIELYDLDENIIAYYMSFEPNGYVIVNNNLDNPIAIEFGDGNNQVIEELIIRNSESKSDQNIIYAGMGYSFFKNDVLSKDSKLTQQSLEEELRLVELYTILDSKNQLAKDQHEKVREMVLDSYKVDAATKGGSYNFIDWNSMPSGTYSSGYIPFGGTTWAVMSNYNSIANNHCGATAATNISLYYAHRGYSNLKKNGSIYDTFVDLHGRIGNGPAMTIASDLKDYASDQGYNMKSSSVGSFSGLKTATTNDRPCGVLLTVAINNWHWVVSSGWREYSNGDCYIRCVNGWEDSANNFFLWKTSNVWSITQYYVQ
jgi:hypothetical protein